MFGFDGINTLQSVNRLLSQMDKAVGVTIFVSVMNPYFAGGAVGDGEHDDAPAFQAAVTFAQPLKMKILVPVPPNKYIFGSTVFIGIEGQRYSCEIEGDSWNADIGQAAVGGVTIELANEVNASMFQVASTAAPCRFHKLRLEGNAANQTGITQAGSSRSYAIWFVDYTIDGARQRAGQINNCLIQSFASGGLRVGQQRSAGIIDGKVTILDCGRKESGTATAGAASTVTLGASASAIDDFYNGMPIVINGGTGIGQMRTISDYVGSTKVATVSVAWEVQPVNGSTYKIGLVLADGIVFGSNNDWRVSGLDTGSHTRHGIYHTGAGSITYDGASNTFANWSHGLQVDATALDMQWFGGSIDTNFGYGVWTRGSVDGKYSRIFHGVRFAGNGCGANNTFADVRVHDDDNVQLLGCIHLKGSDTNTNLRYPKYLVEATGTTARVEVANRRYDRNNIPWVTAEFNDVSKIMLDGGTQMGTGAPTHVARKGTIWLREDGSSSSTRAYIATDNIGGWTPITTAT